MESSFFFDRKQKHVKKKQFQKCHTFFAVKNCECNNKTRVQVLNIPSYVGCTFEMLIVCCATLYYIHCHSPKDLSSHQPYNNCWAPETWLSANDLTSRHIQHTFLRCFNQSVWWNNGNECGSHNMLGEANPWTSRVLSASDDQVESQFFFFKLL